MSEGSGAESPGDDASRVPKRLAVLGSTGSIGQNTLELVRRYPGMFQVTALAGNTNAALLIAQAREFRPACVAVANRAAAKEVRAALPDTEVLEGPEGVEEVAAAEADIALCAIVGAAGLRPLVRALALGRRVAVANKEPLVMAGRLIMEEARRRGGLVLPVDSEHNAIFQCLMGHRIEDVRCIHLTASGGPFYGKPRTVLAGITPEEASVHPTWVMGAKISVDSATLMNKGLEIIEAMWLFDLPEEKIEVVIHPQSIVHSLVEFNDGHLLAHLGVTDMKSPILFALTYPERVKSPLKRLDLTALKELSFAAP
ncbi:MAG: 1-deoxy-D-xylulose-5-phosphate reductoisomerase, partial [Candidatus Hydrogenedentes bacterium]|nr:1-deoxy-D-xylulose-5-phosphate reductoisomerase [Candidatus Hydrogenedentota bacterium]